MKKLFILLLCSSSCAFGSQSYPQGYPPTYQQQQARPAQSAYQAAYPSGSQQSQSYPQGYPPAYQQQARPAQSAYPSGYQQSQSYPQGYPPTYQQQARPAQSAYPSGYQQGQSYPQGYPPAYPQRPSAPAAGYQSPSQPVSSAPTGYPPGYQRGQASPQGYSPVVQPQVQPIEQPTEAKPVSPQRPMAALPTSRPERVTRPSQLEELISNERGTEWDTTQTYGKNGFSVGFEFGNADKINPVWIKVLNAGKESRVFQVVPAGESKTRRNFTTDISQPTALLLWFKEPTQEQLETPDRFYSFPTGRTAYVVWDPKEGLRVTHGRAGGILGRLGKTESNISLASNISQRDIQWIKSANEIRERIRKMLSSRS